MEEDDDSCEKKTKGCSKLNEDFPLEELEETTNVKSPEEKFQDIPFVIGIPVKYKEFEAILKKHRAHFKFHTSSSSEAFNLILTRMVKYNKAGDKSRLPKLFNFIMRYVLDMAERTKKLSMPLLRVLNIALPHLHSLIVLCPNECINAVEDGEIFDDFYPLIGLPVHKVSLFNLSPLPLAQLMWMSNWYPKISPRFYTIVFAHKYSLWQTFITKSSRQWKQGFLKF